MRFRKENHEKLISLISLAGKYLIIRLTIALGTPELVDFFILLYYNYTVL